MKAAAFDLDDTLLRDDLSISPYTLEVFRRLAGRGFFFIADSDHLPTVEGATPTENVGGGRAKK